jgi:tetratricopeptide (TPR) repeat protein
LVLLQRVARRNFRGAEKAYEGLEAIKPELSGDKHALAALGILSEERGDYKQAQELFQEVLNWIREI